MNKDVSKNPKDGAPLRRFADKKPRRARALILTLLFSGLILGLFFMIRPAQVEPEPETYGIRLYSKDKTLLKSISVDIRGSDAYTLINLNDFDLSDENDEIGKEYEVEGRSDFSVDTSKVLSMEYYASDLTALEKAAGAADDPAQFGLSPAQMTVTIGYRDGAQEVLRFGAIAPTGTGYYLLREGDPAVYTISSSAYEAFCRPLSALERTQDADAGY
jgi:hypothetical protein